MNSHYPELPTMQVVHTLPTNSLNVLRSDQIRRTKLAPKDSVPLPNKDVIVGTGSTCQVYRNNA